MSCFVMAGKLGYCFPSDKIIFPTSPFAHSLFIRVSIWLPNIHSGSISPSLGVWQNALWGFPSDTGSGPPRTLWGGVLFTEFCQLQRKFEFIAYFNSLLRKCWSWTILLITWYRYLEWKYDINTLGTNHKGHRSWRTYVLLHDLFFPLRIILCES